MGIIKALYTINMICKQKEILDIANKSNVQINSIYF